MSVAEIYPFGGYAKNPIRGTERQYSTYPFRCSSGLTCTSAVMCLRPRGGRTHGPRCVCRRRPVPSRNEIQHPIVRADDNQRAGTALVIGIPHGGIVAGPAPAVAYQRALLADAPVQDDPNGMAGALHIQQHCAV